MERKYIGLVHKDVDSDYGVSFPDLPGCVTAGSTIEEAREMAAEALALHLDGLAEDGALIPLPVWPTPSSVARTRLTHLPSSLWRRSPLATQPPSMPESAPPSAPAFSPTARDTEAMVRVYDALLAESG